ncbi:indolepyruvate ferredoxin oxidoreductase subunit alpha [Acetivibrio sp. MSJd-27]|uniref:indolepyruvate ferredoxin oxidoreductase subunit alpha n=1 Tax=Acetivibrio sp. MSJd-27 TaxID=2841523 RepID=UPI001C11BD12|nr:indolepyruvate ferredoxin oxidoreductase subunit alpha [Acetivibrio sp. MSJd-27]MBU5451037.1 indolepyruvate ferredoxin oxidoreductase subunit alpha [Acetivibrio sp. MSJd-27]
MKKLLMGNEAIGLAAIRAGVNLVCGYPGTPSTEVLETVAKNNKDHAIHVQWSVNEKVAMEVGAGAAYAGARVMVTMKQVGLNVASDPLMSLAYIGVKGGMIVLVADDPGPISSQTEQDTRRFAQFAKIPVFDPSSPQEAYDMVEAAFRLSEEKGVPVFLRPTTRICHACATVEIAEQWETHPVEGFQKDSKWVIFPRLSYQNHLKLDGIERDLSWSVSPFNRISGTGRKGIVTSGICCSYVKEALDSIGEAAHEIKLFQVGMPYPFPKNMAKDFLNGLDEVLVVEELDPVLEDAFYPLCGERRIKIHGKRDCFTHVAGEFSAELAEQWIRKMLQLEKAEEKAEEIPALPVRPPVLCAGCPHRASFYSVKQAMKGKKAVFSGDIGCYTLGNAKPLDMVDTCLCMGACITIAQGIHNVEPDTKNFAFVGDSTFFHTGIPGIINAVYNETDITVIVLDNSTTAMTGHQPHPGTGRTMMGEITEKVDIEAVLRGCGVKHVVSANPLHLEEAVKAVQQAADFKGVSAVIFKSPCIALFKPERQFQVESEKCIRCKKCIREIGCPAIAVREGEVKIDSSLCYGCGLCAQICPVGAIGGTRHETV